MHTTEDEDEDCATKHIDGQCQTCRAQYSSSFTLTNRRAKGKSSSEYARQHAELRDVQ
jgi:hypothetical protein